MLPLRFAAGFAFITSSAILTACTGGSGYWPPATSSDPGHVQPSSESVRADVRFGLSPRVLAAAQAARGAGYWAHPDKKQATLFVSDLNGAQVRIYPANVKNPTQSGSITEGIDLPINVAADKKGTVYVANNGNSSVTIYPFGQTSPSLTLTDQVVNPNGIAVDSKGTVYVTSGATVGQCYVLEFPTGSTTPSAQVNGLGLPIGLAVDKDGNLYIADAAFGSYKVWEVPAGTTSAQNLNLSGLSDDTGAAVSSANDLYISNYSSNQVLGYHLGQTSAFVTITSGLDAPYALGFSKKGALFVGNYHASVSAFKAGKTTPYETFSNGMVTPTGIALYPGVKL